VREPKRGLERSFVHLMGPIFGTETGRTCHKRSVWIRAILACVTLDQSLQGQRRIEKCSCLQCANGGKDVRVQPA
jgi:hypothetical protein